MFGYLLQSDKASLTHDLNLISQKLKDKQIFITGGTGFFGKWLLNSIKLMNSELQANIGVTVLSRNPKNFIQHFRHLDGDRHFEFIRGDLCEFNYPSGIFDYVIHAASIVHSPILYNSPLDTLRNIIDGTRNILEFARQKAVKAVLLTSSGAVYGKQPFNIENVDENYLGGPDFTDPAQCYHEGKRTAELLAASYYHEFGLNTKIARCFAFLGPHMPLNSHFAAGNFIRDALQGSQIKINGDGIVVRSYMYPTDLVTWLWTILLEGNSARPYNVGSPIAVELPDFAQIIRSEFKVLSGCEKELDVVSSVFSDSGRQGSRYVPCIKRSNRELNLDLKISLVDAVRRTFEWYLSSGSAIHKSTMC